MHDTLDYNQSEKSCKKNKKVTIEETPITIDGKPSNSNKNKKNISNTTKTRKELDENVNRYDIDNKGATEFFQSSRIKKIKLPNCDISRGLALAIIFFVLFTVLIIWFLFSSDTFEADDEENEPRETSRFKNRNKLNKINDTLANNPAKLLINNKNLTNSLLDDVQLEKTLLPTKLFVLVSTVVIVLIIISLVFISACGMYYIKRPRAQSENRSRNQNIVSSIFSHTNTRNSLYYLDQAENEMLNKQASINKASKTSSKSNEGTSTKAVTKPMMSPPIIIINEDSN